MVKIEQLSSVKDYIGKKTVNDSFLSNLSIALTTLFIGLKLTNHIDWNWWLILSPLLCYILLVVVSLIFSIIVFYVVARRFKKITDSIRKEFQFSWKHEGEGNGDTNNSN